MEPKPAIQQSFKEIQGDYLITVIATGFTPLWILKELKRKMSKKAKNRLT